jgi:hypothetical protein
VRYSKFGEVHLHSAKCLLKPYLIACCAALMMLCMRARTRKCP